MLQVTITPKVQVFDGFFLEHDKKTVYKTNAITMTNGHLLLWDNVRDCAVNHKLDFINNFYDIVTA